MRHVFVDTVFWVAQINPEDQYRSAADVAAQKLGVARLVTTDAVLIETLNAFSRFGSYWRVRAAQYMGGVLANPDIEVVRHGHGYLVRGIEFFEQRKDKEYSLTDCISMPVMRDWDITEVLTDERHFRQEGFLMLL